MISEILMVMLEIILFLGLVVSCMATIALSLTGRYKGTSIALLCAFAFLTMWMVIADSMEYGLMSELLWK